MGGPPLCALIATFNKCYVDFIEANRYVGFTPSMLHAKAMAYARDELANTWPVTID